MDKDRQMGASLSPSDMVYKLLRVSEYDILEQFGRFAGSPDDERDGFVHLSFAHQVATTAAKYFKGEDVVVVGLAVTSMGDGLRYEASRDGAVFPHLYGAIVRAMVLSVSPSVWEEDQHVLELKPGALRIAAGGPFGSLLETEIEHEGDLAQSLRDRNLEGLLLGTGAAVLACALPEWSERLAGARNLLREPASG